MPHDPISDAIFDVTHAYRAAMRSSIQAKDLGLNFMHVKCLSFINNRQSCTANDIVNFFNRDKAQIARLIKEMIENQWLTKMANPEDKRSQLLSLTEEGAELASLIAKTQMDVRKKMQTSLSEAELKEFTRIMSIINSNLQSL
ncbi:MarR family winged helix-turn-helix transcriptional regulator [Shewanella youngdeokensis]|uniref:MarR family transcriptional regulator n=1 Tax=Shewanella youngdeokensis TaxID=2999068 RepID=A0ABZ0JYN6_9GAMM|nr:MarR family transcriptional regulator [Shewanella sp. DAU334]